MLISFIFAIAFKDKMYAIVEISGKRFKVEKKQKLFVNRLDVAEGKKISFDDNVTFFSPFNFKTGEVEPNFVYEEDSKNIITEEILNKIEENKDNFSEQEWKSLYKISEETFVEESDSLKQGAAGAGLTDND